MMVRNRRLFASVLFLLAVATGGSPRAAEQVDLELVFLADASGSIDEMEIRFQRQGYAEAITHPRVLAAIEQGYNQRIAVAYMEWGDEFNQAVVAPWTIVDGKESAAAFARVLMETPRQAFGRNAIGSAIAAAHAMIEGNDFSARRRVIDFSGDSANNWNGISIAEARAEALADGIVINGLAILCRHEDCSGRPVGYDLEAAYRQIIIGGPGAFVISADSRARFAEAVRKKMILEIAGSPDAGVRAGRLLKDR